MRGVVERGKEETKRAEVKMLEANGYRSLAEALEALERARKREKPKNAPPPAKKRQARKRP